MSATTLLCSSCGATLVFAPGQHALKCTHCAAENLVPYADEISIADATEELDYQTYLAQAAGNEGLIEVQTVKCPGCGATSQFPPNTTADRCAFCAVPLVAPDAYAQRIIRPRAVAPFEIEEGDARIAFSKWIRSLWFAPNALKKAYSAAAGLRGIYLPYWTYDADTDTSYRGKRGDHYYVTESYTENGQTKSRKVQRTQWTEVSGNVQLSFDDLIVPATTSLPADHLVTLAPWHLGNLQPYRESYLSGFTVEAYQIGVEPGFDMACQQMSGQIRNAIDRDIGGDQQQVSSASTHYSDITFKHLLLPVWLSSYQYSGKTWRYLVNGQTGNVQGERPWSYWKFFFAFAAVLAVLGIAYLWLSRP